MLCWHWTPLLTVQAWKQYTLSLFLVNVWPWAIIRSFYWTHSRSILTSNSPVWATQGTLTPWQRRDCCKVISVQVTALIVRLYLLASDHDCRSLARMYKRDFMHLSQRWSCLQSGKATLLGPYGVFTIAGRYADRHGDTEHGETIRPSHHVCGRHGVPSRRCHGVTASIR